MPVALLETKRYIPNASSDFVHRSRLLRIIDSGTQRKLTLVSTGAGYGKTTLISEWVEYSRPQVAWLSLDRGDEFVLVFDDYHAVEAEAIDKILSFLLEHLPPQMHLIMTTQEDPDLPLARLRARDHLTEIRAIDLQFTDNEASEFLNQAMGLAVSVHDVAILGIRTEGWITGLRLAARYRCTSAGLLPM